MITGVETPIPLFDAARSSGLEDQNSRHEGASGPPVSGPAFHLARPENFWCDLSPPAIMRGKGMRNVIALEFPGHAGAPAHS